MRSTETEHEGIEGHREEIKACSRTGPKYLVLSTKAQEGWVEDVETSPASSQFV